jgi:dTDP-4-amino-4,6-dideoxygalactose transaminase
MAEIHRLSKEYDFKIIEDASHAIGGKYRGERIGNCHYSDITIFSFHPVKIITTGEGGMAITNDATLAEQMSLLRSHGITRDENQMTSASDGAWYYQQIALGFNYRMTDIQAALGISQMARIESFISRRHEIASRYNNLLSTLPVITPFQHTDGHSALHLYVIRLKLSEITKTHRQVFDDLRAAGIGVNLHYIPVYHQPYYEEMGFKRADFPQAEKYYAEAISLPMYPDLTDKMQDEVIAALHNVLRP